MFGILIFSGGIGWNLMRDDDVLVIQRVRDKLIVRNLHTDGDGSWLVSFAARPIVHDAKRRQLVVSGLQFVGDLLDARDPAFAVLSNQPVPKRGEKSKP